jgi:tryptophanyl-tRNA synthetase
VCQLHRFFLSKEAADEMDNACRTARIGCVDRKRALADSILERYGRIAERSRALRSEPERVIEIIKAGSEMARREASRTMNEVHQALRITY